MNLTKLTKRVRLFNVIAVVALIINLLMVFFFAPVERSMGNVHRLLYFHVGSAWVGAVAFGVALICGILYLRKPSKSLDTLSLASVEVGLVFISMAIVSGSIWGRPAWNAYWVWSPRLIGVTVMWLSYAAYFMLRGAIENEERRARFAAIYVIAAFVTVIATYFSTRILRDIHPVVFGGQLESARGLAEGEPELSGVESARMGITMMVSTIAFSLVGLSWIVNRVRLQHILEQAAALKMRVRLRLQQN